MGAVDIEAVRARVQAAAELEVADAPAHLTGEALAEYVTQRVMATLTPAETEAFGRDAHDNKVCACRPLTAADRN